MTERHERKSLLLYSGEWLKICVEIMKAMLKEGCLMFLRDERGLNEQVREHGGFQYQIIKDKSILRRRLWNQYTAHLNSHISHTLYVRTHFRCFPMCLFISLFRKYLENNFRCLLQSTSRLEVLLCEKNHSLKSHPLFFMALMCKKCTKNVSFFESFVL